MTTAGVASTPEPTTSAPGDVEAAAPLGRTLGLARPAAGRVALATLLGAGAVAAAIGLMATSAWLISRAAQHPPEAELALAIVGVQFFGLSRGFFRYGERLVGHDAAFRALADLRVRVYRHLEQLAPAGLPAFRSGDLLARLVSDVDSLQDLILRVVPPFAVAVVVGVATVAFVWTLLPGAALVLGMALLLAATVVPWLTGALARRREARLAGARGDLAASVVDLVEGAPELVAFGATGDQLARIAAADDELRTIAAASAATAGVGLGLTTLLAGLATWGAVVVGVPAVDSGRMNGALLAVVALIPLAAFELVVGLPVATQSLQRARRASQRVFGVLDAPAPVTDPAVRAPLPAPPHSLEARSVWAAYPGAGRDPVLRGVALSLAPGRRVAVVGPSGAGKTTIAGVLLRFLPWEEGSVALSCTSLDHLAGDDVRRVVGMVDQEPHLFDTTLGENLRIGRRQATDEELEQVLRRVGLGAWLEGLPAGLGTAVGRRGSRLSGGQRQRVAIARALVARFGILVLDEPAEHLDPEAAEAVTTDLLELTAGRSTLFITHRLSGLEDVDEVMVVDHGRVVERGTHDALVSAGGWYADRWREQNQDAPAAGTSAPPVTGVDRGEP
jgi:thiol reductant ABC exporter CydC subunit